MIIITIEKIDIQKIQKMILIKIEIIKIIKIILKEQMKGKVTVLLQELLEILEMKQNQR